MTLTVRIVGTTLTALTIWLSGASVAAAATSPSTSQLAIGAVGSDTPRSILYAGIAGLAVGGVIAFWQSRKRRRNDVEKPGGEPDSSDD